MRRLIVTGMTLALVLSMTPACKKKEADKDGAKDPAADKMAPPDEPMDMEVAMAPDDMGAMAPDEMGAMAPDDMGAMAPDDMGAMAPDAPAGEAKTMTSKDGAVTITVPAGPGWGCTDKQAKGPGGKPASVITCRRQDRAEFYFMMAKVYGVDAKEVKPAKELATKIFMATYAKMFKGHKIVKEGVAKLGELEGYETVLELTHPAMGAVAKTERVFTQGEQVFIVSGEGKADVAPKFVKELEAWFQNAKFKALAK